MSFYEPDSVPLWRYIALVGGFFGLLAAGVWALNLNSSSQAPSTQPFTARSSTISPAPAPLPARSKLNV